MPQPRTLGRRQRRAAKMRTGGKVRATRGRLVSNLEHPADRIEDRHGRFDQFAQRASFLASSSLFFVLCAVLVIGWAVGLATGASNRFESAAAGLMSAVTLILVAVLKNSELRTERALQTKLDAIASSLLEDRRGDRGGPADAGDAESQLEHSIGLHEEI